MIKKITILLLLLVSSCSYKATKKNTIAILVPATHPSLEEIEKGFRDTIETQYPGKYRFVTYNAQGNPSLMRAEIGTIFRQPCSLILTVGTLASQMLFEVSTQKKQSVPIVFTCVHDPLGFHLICSEEHPGGCITGVKELVDLPKTLSQLLDYAPKTRNLLLVYNPTEPGLVRDQQELALLSQQYGLHLTTVEIFQNNEILKKVAPFMRNTDAVIVLKDNTVVGGLDALVHLCSDYHVPLIANDLDSPDRGAAMGYGVHEIEFGIEAALKAIPILEHQVVPGSIPVTAVSHFTLKINTDAAAQQGLVILNKNGDDV